MWQSQEDVRGVLLDGTERRERRSRDGQNQPHLSSTKILDQVEDDVAKGEQEKGCCRWRTKVPDRGRTRKESRPRRRKNKTKLP